jgi:Peroxisomal biogenesis factor 11 (PEX11)
MRWSLQRCSQEQDVIRALPSVHAGPRGAPSATRRQPSTRKMPDPAATASPTLVLAPLSSSLSWHEALSHPDGRERLFRLLQYALKFIRGAVAGRATSHPALPLVARVAALESALAAARQVWRLFKWTGFYSKTSLTPLLRAPAAISQTPLATALATLQDACLASYMALDNVTFLTKISLIRGDAGAAARRAARAWLAASLLGLTGALRRLYASGRAEKHLERRLRQRDLALAAKYGGDVVVAYSLCRAGNDSPIAHPALVGACGVVSSLVGFSDVWPRRPLSLPPAERAAAPSPGSPTSPVSRKSSASASRGLTTAVRR